MTAMLLNRSGSSYQERLQRIVIVLLKAQSTVFGGYGCCSLVRGFALLECAASKLGRVSLGNVSKHYRLRWKFLVVLEVELADNGSGDPNSESNESGVHHGVLS